MMAEKRVAVRLVGPDRASRRLKVLLFPFEAGSSGSGEKPNRAFHVHYFPVLSGVVEFDGGGLGDFQVAKVV